MSAELLVPTTEVTPAILKQRIYDFEKFMRTLPQTPVPVQHFFTPGIYVRQIVIPKGMYCTGSVYKAEHVHFILQGDMTVATEQGIMRVKGPFTFISQPGFKRAGYAHEETTWAAVFRTDKTDPEEIMKDLTVEEFYEDIDHDSRQIQQ